MDFPPNGLDRRELLAAVGATAALGIAPKRAVTAPKPATTNAIDPAVGAMIVIGFYGAEPAAPGVRAVADWLRRGAVGGVIFFEDNCRDPESLRRLTDYFKAAAGRTTPFLSIDQEGGGVARLRPENGFTPLPAAREVAELPPDEANSLYERTAAELRRLGLNVNFGPVVDLAENQSSRIIVGLGRSYSADPRKVVDYARVFIDAHRRHHIMTALKHFPGHGSTALDSHKSLPDITANWSHDELKPFAELANTGYADMVMVGHLVHARLTEPRRPASLSPRAVAGLLREELGYRGVVVSDDMQMGALRNSFSPDEAILLGVEAGVDLFIFSNREHSDPQMPERFHRVVRAAKNSGRLAPTRIRETVARLDALKRSIDSASAGNAASRH